MSAPDTFASAQFFFEHRRFTEAAAALVDVLADTPDFAPAHALLALCQCALKQNTLAKYHAEKAIELAPNDSYHHHILSRVLVRFFDWELVAMYAREGQRVVLKAIAAPASMRAVQAIEEAIRLDPTIADYYAHLASLNLMFARWSEAVDATNRGLEQDPTSIACLHYRAAAWLEMDELAKSEEAAKCLLALDPNSPHGHAGLGDLSLYRREAKTAERHYREALRLDPLLAWAEQGLEAARRMETDRAIVRELATAHQDPVFADPYRLHRWLHLSGKVILGVAAAAVLGQLVTASLWPGHDLFHLLIKFLTRL